MRRLYSIILALILISCEGDQSVSYIFTGLELEHITSQYGQNRVTASAEQSSSTYGIRCNLSPVETYRKGRYFDPYESYVSCDDPIRFIYITATNDFDAEHPAGHLLNDFFYYNPGNLREAVYLHGDTIAPDIDMKLLPTYPNSNFPEYADFMLSQPIESTSDIAFVVRLVTQSGQTFIDTTSTIHLD